MWLNLFDQSEPPVAHPYLEARVAGEEPVQADVHDFGDGSYEFTYEVTRAGHVELALILARQSPTVRVLPVTCEAADMDAHQCRVDAGKMILQWPAGEAGVVRVQRRREKKVI